jgi:hypothetical protein
LKNGMVFCRVASWLTGRRLVSLPFSDHCDPLVDCDRDLTTVMAALQAELSRNQLSYIEIRPTRSLEVMTPQHSTYPYCRHEIDLTQDLGALFNNCHKSCIQRKIVRADREGLTEEVGRSGRLLDRFYSLLLLTRRRLSALPQPKRWFQNLIDCFGEALTVRVASKDGQAIAAILTLRFKDTLIYKYGCSDARFHRLGGMPFLLWKSICDAKRDGFRVLDLGRTEWHDAGLIYFKDRWGASRSVLTYSRLTGAGWVNGAFKPHSADWKRRVAKRIFVHSPDRVLGAAGELLYRHAG